MVIIRVLSASLAAVALLSAAGCASAAGDAQTIYLDPDTGRVVQHPAPEAPPAAHSSQRAGKAPARTGKKSSGDQRWTTPDGTQMLAIDPNKQPDERVVRCADGSLRMGHTGGEVDRQSADLCGKPRR